jgi:hypothetical protein
MHERQTFRTTPSQTAAINDCYIAIIHLFKSYRSARQNRLNTSGQDIKKESRPTIATDSQHRGIYKAGPAKQRIPKTFTALGIPLAAGPLAYRYARVRS